MSGLVGVSRDAQRFLRAISPLLAAAFLVCVVLVLPPGGVHGAGPAGASGAYHVMEPIESGGLLLFPVVPGNRNFPLTTHFLTLDEGLKSGSVEVTESGRVRGLVRPREQGPIARPRMPFGDQVNTLVLVNHSDRPLLLLAGEVVTGGKQDRVIAKDRIVPPGADPIDLSVFCIEPGRWIESSPIFGASSKAPSAGFMVQPLVREQAMAAKNQQQVWNSVRGAISIFDTLAASSGGPILRGPVATTSYAKAMQSEAIQDKVDEAAAPLTRDREQVLAQLKRDGAVGVVVAIHDQIVWADIFASPDLLARYWTKLVRSYAAETLDPGDSMTTHPRPGTADAQHFLEPPSGGTETSEGTVGVYRYLELKSAGTETFTLESLLPDARYDVHVSKMRLRHAAGKPFMPLEELRPAPGRPEFRLLPQPLERP